jgi:hypothetical protein
MDTYLSRSAFTGAVLSAIRRGKHMVESGVG